MHRARIRPLLRLCLLGTGLSLVGLVVPAVVSGADPGVAAVRIDGKGFGHGVGLAQDGALSMGQAGAGTLQILNQFYPGTTLARAGGEVRVAVLAGAGADAVVSFPGGGQVQDAASGPQSPGFPLRVAPGSQVDLHYDGSRYTATVSGGGTRTAGPALAASAPQAGAPVSPPPPSSSTTSTTSSTSSTSTTSTTSPLPTVPRSPGSTTTTTAPVRVPSSSTTTSTTQPRQMPGPTTTTTAPPAASASSGRPLWAVPDNSGTTTVAATGRQYRGEVEAVAGAGPGLDLVNQLDVEQYLMGMGEVQNPSWPLASLQAQVIVERTYALRAMQSADELCADTRCQVYLGVQGEYAAQNSAVSSTKGYVLTYGSAMAATVFSANAGGYTATPEEGFGTPDDGYPYLRAAPYPTNDPFPWSLTVALSDVASRLGYTGTVTSVRVATIGPSTRATAVVVDGTAGPQTVSGLAFAAALGLRSSMFQLHDVVSATALPPPPPAQAQQALPTDASALAAAVATPVRRSVRPPLALGPGRHHHPGGTAPWSWLALGLVVAAAGAVSVSSRGPFRSSSGGTRT